MEQKQENKAPVALSIMDMVAVKFVQKWVAEAQNQHGMKQGVYFTEFLKISGSSWTVQLMKKAGSDVAEGITNFLKAIVCDKIYINHDCTQYSTVPLDGYCLWSEHIKSIYNGYVFTSDWKLVNDGSPMLSFSKHLELLTSKENSQESITAFENLYKDYGSLFLNGEEPVQGIFFSSFMRSGNTLFRKSFEAITGTVTGSCYSNTNHFNFQGLAQGFKGENHYNNKVWMIKTHYPFMSGIEKAGDISGRKAIVCIRNPLDVIASFFQFLSTQSHNLSSKQEYHLQNPETWDWFVKDTAKQWMEALDYWRNIATQGQIPVYFFRYEDLMLNRQPILEETMKFALNLSTLEGTYVQARIDVTMKDWERSTTLYKPRSGMTNTNRHLFTEEQIEFIKEQCKDHLIYMGYTSITDKGDSQTAYFDYESHTDMQYPVLSQTFVEHNARTLASITDPSNDQKVIRILMTASQEQQAEFKRRGPIVEKMIMESQLR